MKLRTYIDVNDYLLFASNGSLTTLEYSQADDTATVRFNNNTWWNCPISGSRNTGRDGEVYVLALTF